MNLANDVELANTRDKLAELEAHYEEMRNSPADDEHVRQATLRSLMKYINQFKEEIARYEARQAAQH